MAATAAGATLAAMVGMRAHGAHLREAVELHALPGHGDQPAIPAKAEIAAETMRPRPEGAGFGERHQCCHVGDVVLAERREFRVRRRERRARDHLQHRRAAHHVEVLRRRDVGFLEQGDGIPGRDQRHQGRDAGIRREIGGGGKPRDVRGVAPRLAADFGERGLGLGEGRPDRSVEG